ncbi:MAG: hypothetical protein ACKVP5_10205 [Aestuariivirga sp.]
MPELKQKTGSTSALEPSVDEIDAAISRIDSSGVLGQSSRLEALLRFVIQEEREGRGDRIKAYTVATAVLGRAESFDPSVDSIVRVEFRRLRQALIHYYATAGANEPFVIHIPLGSYRPEFKKPGVVASAIPAHEGPRPSKRKWLAAASLMIAAALALLAIETLTGRSLLRNLEALSEEKLAVALEPVQWSTYDQSLADTAAGLHGQLLVGMTRFRFLSILDGTDADLVRPPETFRLKIRLQRSPSTVRMIAELVDPLGIQEWGQTYDAPAEANDTTEDYLTARLLADLRPRIFIGARRFYDRAKVDRAPKSVWAAFIKATWVSANQVTSLDWEKQRIVLAEEALRTKPGFGPAHSLLAQKLSYLMAVDPPYDTPEVRRRAALHASRAMDLDAADPDTVFNVGLYYWNVGRIEDSLIALRRSVELDPNHALAKALIDPIKHFCTEVPQQEIADIQRLDSEISPDNPFRWVAHTFLGDAHADNDDWQVAETIFRKATQMLVSPETFLRLTLALQKNGKSTEAEVILALQRENWPNLNLRHYARVNYADRCGTTPYSELRIRLLNELAELAEQP